MSGQFVERQEEMGAMREYPLVPLKNVVVFPRTRVNLTIVRPRSVQAVMEADKGSRIFVAAKQRLSDTDDPQPEDIYQIATVVQILSLQPQDNGVQLVVEGLRRIQIEDWLHREPFLRVVAMRIPEPSSSTPAAQALVRHAHELFESYTQLNRRFSAQEMESVMSLRSATRLADVLAASLVNDHELQQDLLETIDPEQRLEKVCVILGNEIGVLELDKRIRERVRDQVDTNQKAYYLKEQLIAIQKELGQDIASETQELRDRASAKGMPPEIETKTLKEIAKLERMPVNSAEVGVLRNYIDWMLSLPWKERSDDHLDTKEVAQVLDTDHYGLVRVKDRILDFLAVRQRRASLAERTVTDDGDDELARIAKGRAVNRGPILCLIGPPGVGKTSLGESIAHAMGRKFVRIPLGGVHDEAEIRGHRRTYVGALPGKIIQAMKTAGVRNPVFLLDEIDKLASDYRGDPAAALLEVLDPAQNHTFTDHYIEAQYDLSEVFFICTGNNRFGIPRALADRMEIIEIPGYTEEEKVAIARRFIWPKMLNEFVLDDKTVRISDSVLQWVVSAYTREAGVRSLERQIATLGRKVARRFNDDEEKNVRLTKKLVEEFLGIPRYAENQTIEADQIGVATGLAWTEHGGTLLPVEVAVVAGRGSVQLTGQQGDVMQESARAAFTYIRTRAEHLGISTNFADQVDMHVHLPEGAIPKDGPSAGITIATAMISALTRRPVRADTAMTGEITLRGRILPIGGLRDKILAAHRVGIRRIIMPIENKKDIIEIPERIRGQMEFIYVTQMEDVEVAALRANEVGESDRTDDVPHFVAGNGHRDVPPVTEPSSDVLLDTPPQPHDEHPLSHARDNLARKSSKTP